MKFYPRLFEPPKQSFFLFGPRGTGKSMLMRHLFADALWLDLLNPEVFRSYSARPEKLFELVRGNPDKQTICIDEVQKIPSLLSVVHALIEEFPNKQFILSGSSARKLKRAGADLLAGRALKCTLHPFMAKEIASDFSLSSALQQGLLPLIRHSKAPIDTLYTYVGLYLQEEIQTEGLVRNLGSFSRFLETTSFSHGAELNIANISRECEVKRKTVENYIEILEDLLLAYQLPVFAKRASRALTSHPKFYLFDPGIYRALRPKGPLDSSSETEGHALEGLVAQHLIAWNDYSRENHEIGFWRTRGGLEVDFVVHGANCFVALDVKNATKVFPQDCRGLEEFIKDYPMAKAILLYRGKERLCIRNTQCIPVDQFLLSIEPNNALLH